MSPGKFPKVGLTLTELLVAVMSISVVIMGIMSTDYAVRKNAQDASATASLNLKTHAVLNHIINNALPAVGDKDSKGIRYPGDESWFCLRQDASATAGVYTDDNWVCYTVVGSALYTCTNPPASNPALNPLPVPATAGPCRASDTLVEGSRGIMLSVNPDYSATSNIFGVTVATRTNPASSKSTSNPEVSASSSISPWGHSI